MADVCVGGGGGGEGGLRRYMLTSETTDDTKDCTSGVFGYRRLRPGLPYTQRETEALHARGCDRWGISDRQQSQPTAPSEVGGEGCGGATTTFVCWGKGWICVYVCMCVCVHQFVKCNNPPGSWEKMARGEEEKVNASSEPQRIGTAVERGRWCGRHCRGTEERGEEARR